MKQKHSPAQKRLTTLQMFYNYCCETYKNKLDGNDELLEQVYKIIDDRTYFRSDLELFYKLNGIKNNKVYLNILKDFITHDPKYFGLYKMCWITRQTSMAIIKLINEKL